MVAKALTSGYLPIGAAIAARNFKNVLVKIKFVYTPVYTGAKAASTAAGMTNFDIIKEIYAISKEVEKQSRWERDGTEQIERIIKLIEKKRPTINAKKI